MIERLPAMAAELVRLKVDVIVVLATQAGRAAQRATNTIPIVIGPKATLEPAASRQLARERHQRAREAMPKRGVAERYLQQLHR
jgi:putative ABC transport system substrate-binding protein